MHILVLPSWYPTTYNPLLGIFFKEQAEALAKYGNKVGIIALQDIGIRNVLREKKVKVSFDKFIENGVNIYRLQYLDIIKNKTIVKKIKMYFFKRILEKYIKENGIPDIVHLHSFLVGDFALYIKEVYNIPYVVTEHLSAFYLNKFNLNKILESKNIYKNSSYNIVVSSSFKELMQKEFSLEFNYIPNIVNTNFFDIRYKIRNTNEFKFINIAHLEKNKNQDLLIKAFTKKFKNNDNVSLTIVGEGPEYFNLKKLIKDLNMEKQIKLYGKSSREEVRNLLQNSDAFVLSSKYETFGVVVIEAMACGLPVVATKCGGPESIIVSNKLGFLSEINEEDFSKKIFELYLKRKEFNSKYIRNYIVKNFSEEAVCLKLNKVYKKVVE